MKLYGQAENAQLENKAADYTAGPVGRIWWNTTSGQAKIDDGTNIRALIRNDQKAIFGNNGTAANNIRLHRGAAGVLQFVAGDDVTAEGTLATALNQISSKFENYTDATKPAFGNPGRVIWVTDLVSLYVDTGSSWAAIGGASTVARVDALYDWVIGSAGQVISGAATHSTWAGAIAAASAGDSIKVLKGAWTENVSVNKALTIEGSGPGSVLTGSVTFTSAADESLLTKIRLTDNITLDSGADMIRVSDVWLASGKTFIDNGTGNYVDGFQET